MPHRDPVAFVACCRRESVAAHLRLGRVRAHSPLLTFEWSFPERDGQGESWTFSASYGATFIDYPGIGRTTIAHLISLGGTVGR
jgi:hypothetical protein